jgi:hypothetical protein
MTAVRPRPAVLGLRFAPGDLNISGPNPAIAGFAFPDDDFGCLFSAIEGAAPCRVAEQWRIFVAEGASAPVRKCLIP